LKPYDVIQSLNGTAITNFAQLRTRLAFTKPGTEIKLGILRDGRAIEVKVKIGQFSPEVAQRGGQDNGSGESSGVVGEFGLSLKNLNAAQRKQLEIRSKKGVLVTAVAQDSYAAYAGLRRGDVITEVNRRSVNSVTDIEKALSGSKDKPKDLLFLIERDGRNQLIVLRQR
jgi:S1-C subfamily serine protease